MGEHLAKLAGLVFGVTLISVIVEMRSLDEEGCKTD